LPPIKIEFSHNFVARCTFKLREEFMLWLTRSTGAKDPNLGGTRTDTLNQ
jgi:hypothetical protein